MKYLDNEASVKMVQTSTNRWQITTRSGYVIQDEIICGKITEAEEYIKNYISSYSCWSYEVIPLLPKGNTK